MAVRCTAANLSPSPSRWEWARETSDRPNRTGWWLTHGSCDQHSERSRALVSACEQSLCWFGQVIDAGCSPHGREKPILGTTLAMVGLNDAYPGRRRDQGRFVGKGKLSVDACVVWRRRGRHQSPGERRVEANSCCSEMPPRFFVRDFAE
jgi:hypothetical protein